MKPLTFLLIAGDPSGDMAVADLVQALREESGPVGPRFIGAGGPRMAASGVNLAAELTAHSVIGLEILKQFRFFQRTFRSLLDLADRELPDAVIGVDYAGFNLRFATAIRRRLANRQGPFHNWNPFLVQFISPQVWASRPARAKRMERILDLLLSILPFERSWFQRISPNLPVEFVGHPLVDRRSTTHPMNSAKPNAEPTLLLLPGSRAGELHRHLPVMVPAALLVQRETGIRIRMVLPTEALGNMARQQVPPDFPGTIEVGALDDALDGATLAIASTGTVTLECAWFGVPTLALYKTSRLTYEIGRRIITVDHLAMPNLLAGRTLMPEFIQDDANPSRLAAAALTLIGDEKQRAAIRNDLLGVARSLGPPGASRRAARAILSRLRPA